MKKTNPNTEIETWKEEIQSEDWNIASNAAENLANIGGNDIVNFLIGLLDSEEVLIRNVAALSLRQIKDNRAINPLLKSILKPENKNYNGTMVYALQTLDCKDIIVELFEILFNQSYESKLMAYMILDKQIFEFSRKDLMKIQELNKKYEKVIEIEDERTKLMITDTYEGFMEYLEEKKEP